VNAQTERSAMRGAYDRRMAHTMSDVERRAFLSDGTHTAKLATTLKDGRPHVLPVWFVLDGDDLLFNAVASRGRTGARCSGRRAPPRSGGRGGGADGWSPLSA